jgi:hypothetical protein
VLGHTSRAITHSARGNASGTCSTHIVDMRSGKKVQWHVQHSQCEWTCATCSGKKRAREFTRMQFGRECGCCVSSGRECMRCVSCGAVRSSPQSAQSRR